MKKSIISLFIGLLSFGAFTTSCEDMLTPDLQRYATEFTGNDTVNFYIGIIGNLQQVVEQNCLLGELRGDLVKPTNYVTDSISDIMLFKHSMIGGKPANQPEDADNQLLNRAAYYKVINQCNYYLSRVDSLSVRNGYHYMQKETAQVLLIRAWTYMQLVQNYGSVPFITKPVSVSTTGWETNPEAWATHDNLLDLLKHDLDQAWTYCEVEGYPSYGSINTGSAKISQSLINFDADVVLGDLYLLRGRDKTDFEKAAEHFYNFIYKNERTKSRVNPDDYALVDENDMVEPPTYSSANTTWRGDARNVSYSFSNNEIITGIPSAANSYFGNVLTRIPNIYGFDIHSTNATNKNDGVADDASDDDKYSTTGYVSITPNYRVRQVEPSDSYIALNRDQVVVYTNNQKQQEYYKYPSGLADARMMYSAPEVNVSNQGRMRFIAKFGGANSVVNDQARSFSFRYIIPVYRMRTIMLRYAEALNRAGYPQHAFAILRDGLNPETYPVLAADSIVDEENQKVTNFTTIDTLNIEGRVRDISDDELIRAQEKTWISNIILGNFNHIGIHQAGCGKFDYSMLSGSTDIYRDTVYRYTVQVEKRLKEELAVPTRPSRYSDTNGNIELHHFSKPKTEIVEPEPEEGEGEGEGEGDPEPEPQPIDTSDFDHVTLTPANATADEMFAVELLIADEYALESAFEGNRYYDLMRIARHLNTYEGNGYGTEWMAWKIARSRTNLVNAGSRWPISTYEEPTRLDGGIYSYLQNINNWYLQNPKY